MARKNFDAGMNTGNEHKSQLSAKLIGCRIPKDFFITSGRGESDITVHAGSYHMALKDAGIEMCNIMNYSSILPGIAQEVPMPKSFVHGSVMETISAVSTAPKGKRATAAIIFGWLFDRKTYKKYGGLVCEYNGELTAGAAEKQLRSSLNEIYCNGFSERYELGGRKFMAESFIPKKKFGTVMVVIGFINYIYPVIR
jgi:arginine decarboxylase